MTAQDVYVLATVVVCGTVGLSWPLLWWRRTHPQHWGARLATWLLVPLGAYLWIGLWYQRGGWIGAIGAASLFLPLVTRHRG